LRPLYPGLHAVAAAMTTSGALARWYRDTFPGETPRPSEQQRGDAYARLAREAAAIPPGSAGLVVLPYFSGERAPIHDDLARGGIFGLALNHGRGHLYRALLEGVAYGLQHNLDHVRAAHVPLRRIVATGGGTRNRLWTQIVSDVTGLSQAVIAPSNAALGAAFLAGYALESFDRVNDVRLWAQSEKEVHPRGEIHEIYQGYYRLYRRLYERTKEEMHELARLSAEAPLTEMPVLSDALAARIA
jgi:xylulokinase